jgi:cytochrome c7-like protein
MRRVLLVLGGLAVGILVLPVAGIVALLRRRRPRRPAPPARPTETLPGRLLLVGLPALGLVGAAFYLSLAAPWLLAQQHYPTTPKQPIPFDHRLHVEQVGLDCAFCHRTADRGDTAGLPDVQQCMFCHIAVEPGAVGQQNAVPIAQVRGAWTDQQVIDWVRIHHVPDHSRFPHDAHVQAGLACETCHGDVGRMRQVVQVRSLKMGDCVACHQEMRAPTQCGVCHY